MAYTDNKAPKRDADQTNVTDDFNPVNVQTRTVPVDTSKYNVGNHIRVGANTKGSTSLKSPLQTYRRTVLAGVQNPDGKTNRP